MWFRNLLIYPLNAPFELSAEALHEELSTRHWRECGNLELSALGWEPPLGRYGTQLTHAVGNCIMICMRREEKVMPAAVVNQQLAQRVNALEEKEGRKVRRREQAEMKDEIILDLLPKAFVKTVLTYAYIDSGNGWLLVDTSSTKRAEDLISLLRETLGSLPLNPLQLNDSPVTEMTRWLQGGGVPREFVIGDECEMRDPAEEGSMVRCRRLDLEGKEIAGHLKAGKEVVKIAVEWQQKISFVLTAEAALKRLKFLDLIQEAAAESEAEDEASRFDGDFAVMSLELGSLINSLIGLFGGIVKE
ncbi:MAG: recombination-associated protein RdgC [Gammaproteobacteria bacterium]|nr:recombination-associated protein RdgC [Gammaproteobacteria bacterium]MCP5418243.1 recombination-associated protein RdgC [Chromatiaceae bacterium]